MPIIRKAVRIAEVRVLHAKLCGSGIHQCNKGFHISGNIFAYYFRGLISGRKQQAIKCTFQAYTIPYFKTTSGSIPMTYIISRFRNRQNILQLSLLQSK